MELLWVGPERGAVRDLVEAQMTALGYARHEWRRVGSVEEALTVSDTPSAAWRLVAVGDVVLLRRYDLSAITAGAPPDARRLVLDAPSSSETSRVWRCVGASAGDSAFFATRACDAEHGTPVAEPGAEYAFRWSLAGGPPTSDAEDAALAALARPEPPLSPPARHLSFWGGFADTCPHFLERVIRGATRGVNFDRSVTFVSVFPNRLPLELGAGDGDLRVAFSGEVYSQDASAFDLNLIMEATDAARRTVCCPLFSYFAYHCSGMSAGFNSWPLLARPRPRPPAPRPLFCATTVSNPNGAERNRFIEKLAAAAAVAARTQHGRVAQHGRLDSMGAVLNNCGGRRLSRGTAGRAELGAYRFVVCFENTFASHYLTEKLLEAWVAGAVPIYGGASMAREWLNPDAFLQLEDASEAGMDRLVARVLELDADPVAYEAMRALPLLRGPGAPAPLSVEGMAEAAAAVLATRAGNPRTN